MCGSVFGGGKVSAPEIQQVAPSATNVTTQDIGAEGSADSEAARRQRAKRGYAATRLAQTIAGQAASGKTTLG